MPNISSMPSKINKTKIIRRTKNKIDNKANDNEAIDNKLNDQPKDQSINNLTTNQIFRLADLYFNQKNYMFRHLYDSYNKFLEEDIKNFLEHGEHVFTESMTATTYFRYRFKFANVRVFEPVLENGIEPMFPSDARHNSLTYSVKLVADTTQYQDVIDIATDELKINKVGDTELSVPISTIPLMLRSKWCSLTTHKDLDKNECNYDPGGYFIVGGVGGNEKVIICQDRMVENKPLVFTKKDAGTISYTIQVNSRSYKAQSMTQIVSIKIKKDEIMTIKVPIITEINVCVLFRVLGLETDRDIIDYITYNSNDTYMAAIVRASLDACKNEKGQKIQTREDAIDYLIPKLRVLRRYTETNKETKLLQKKMHLINLLTNSFLPHVEGGLKNKAFYLGYMVNRLLRVVLGRLPPDDRDSYVNKRVDMPGDLLFELFRPQFKKMLGECKKFFDNRNKDVFKPINVISHIKPNIIEQGLKASLSTGHWIRRQGVSQMLQRLTYLQTISFLRRVDASGGDASTAKLTLPRYLHPSSVGGLCCVQTPDHGKVGLIKHLSIIGSLTIMSKDQYQNLKDFLGKRVINTNDIPPYELQDAGVYKVLLNGDWLGISKEPMELEEEIITMRFNGKFDQKNVSVVVDHDESEVKVYCCSGRLVRPTIRVINNEVLLKSKQIEHISLNKADKLDKITDWDGFLSKYPGVIDYVCAEIQPFILISDKVKNVEVMRKKMVASVEKVRGIKSRHVDDRYDDMFFLRYTHCEIHPSLLVGEITTNVPFADHNPGARNIFQYAQGKQAMGMYATNYRDRLDISFILYYPQKPLVTTMTAKYINSEVLPWGENAVVATGCYTGYNQEDSLIFNGTSINRGKFRSMYLKKYIISVQKNQSNSQDDVFMKPDTSKLLNSRSSNFETLNDAGFAPEETVLKNGDAIFGKCTPTGDARKPYKDASEIYKMNAIGVVDRVYIGIQNNEGYETRKALIRSERVPNIGDKYCCYDGETEVLTNEGWVRFGDLVMGMKVAVLVDGGLEYREPVEIQKYEYDGMMYSLEGDEISLLVTPNHRMWVRGGEGGEGGEGGRGGFRAELAEHIYGRKMMHSNMVRTYRGGRENFEMTHDQVWGLSMEECRKIYESMSHDNMSQDEIQRWRLHGGYGRDDLKGYEEWIPYKGMVYCCTVPTEEGVVYVRRKGMPVWCGNSRHGQKGTIGIKLRGNDMPFTKEGIRPDIILNPNAIPSRRTIGQLIECLMGKVAALQGLDADGTPFEDHDLEALKDTLESLGYSRDGKEYLINGMTGEKMKGMMFIGPTYYQRLKHLVEDKIHSRARGPKTAHTHQAPEGRSRDGGLRVGEMERDTLLAHGVVKFAKEKLMDNSDAYSAYICDKCGLFATRFQRNEDNAFSSEDDIYYCPSCNNHNETSKVRIPYAFKLFLQELTSMCIAPRIRIKKNIYKS